MDKMPHNRPDQVVLWASLVKGKNTIKQLFLFLVGYKLGYLFYFVFSLAYKLLKTITLTPST
jgi:hypothetical protein